MRRYYATERKGIAAIQAKLADLELIWRETSTGDFGIDRGGPHFSDRAISSHDRH